MHQESRGLLAGFAIGELKTKITREPYAKLWTRLKMRTREVMKAARDSGFEVGTGGLGWHSRTPMLPEAALLARLAEDGDALRYVEECIDFLNAFSRQKMADGDRALLLHSHAEVAMATDMLRDLLSPEALEALLGFMREIAIDYHAGMDSYIMYGGGGNIVWCHNVQAAVCALLWGEDCAHPAWQEVVEHGINHTRCYLKYGCDASGFSYEGTGYGHGVFQVMFMFVQLLQQSGHADLYRTEPRLREIIEASLRVLFPDHSFLTNDNDVGLIGAESMPYLLLAHRAYGDPLYLGFWYAYQGPDNPRRPYGDIRPWVNQLTGIAEPTPDAVFSLAMAVLYWDADAPRIELAQADRPTAHYAPGTETANLRSSWRTDAVYVNIQGAGRSHMSQTHRHADAGHFAIFAHGDYLAIDTGRYNSDEDQHNVVLVDGKCHRPIAPGWGMDPLSGRLSKFQQTELLSYVRADMAQEKACFWADRHFLFVPWGPDDAYLVVLDNLNRDNQKHSYWWQLQGNPEFAFTIDGERRATLHGKNARLDINFAIPSPQDFPEEPHTIKLRQDVKEWHWPYGREQDTDVMEKHGLLVSSVRRPRLIAEVTGLNGMILAVISPRRQNAEPLAVRQLEERRILRIEIACGAFTDTVLAALDHGFIRLDGIEALTELAFMRRDSSGKLIGSWTIDGSPLQIH